MHHAQIVIDTNQKISPCPQPLFWTDISAPASTCRYLRSAPPHRGKEVIETARNNHIIQEWTRCIKISFWMWKFRWRKRTLRSVERLRNTILDLGKIEALSKQSRFFRKLKWRLFKRRLRIEQRSRLSCAGNPITKFLASFQLSERLFWTLRVEHCFWINRSLKSKLRTLKDHSRKRKI